VEERKETARIIKGRELSEKDSEKEEIKNE
jgi:hypothetical protein